MAYTQADLVTEVQTRAKDSSFSSTLIGQYLTYAQNRYFNRNLSTSLHTRDSDTVSAGDSTYEPDAEVDVIFTLSLTDSTGNVFAPNEMAPKAFFELYQTPEANTASSPTAYTVFANEIVFNAPLDRAYTIDLKYLRVQGTLTTSADVPDLPERWREYLVLLALADVHEYRENFDMAGLKRQDAEQLEEDMRTRGALRTMAPGKATFGGSNGSSL
jgi:hypothetical protein